MSATQDGKIKVIVVDDDRDFCYILCSTLNRNGYQAWAIPDPEQAAKAAELWGSPVVLCDILMEGVDGIELTCQLKTSNPGSQVILMSGDADLLEKEEWRDSGADDFLRKPFASLNEVCQSIERAASKINDYRENLHEYLKNEFPYEYDIIYKSDHPGPTPEALEELLKKARDRRQAEQG